MFHELFMWVTCAHPSLNLARLLVNALAERDVINDTIPKGTPLANAASVGRVGAIKDPRFVAKFRGSNGFRILSDQLSHRRLHITMTSF